MPTTSAFLQVKGLSKRFGDYRALADITFDIHEHEIVGLIGPNGAGKTTLLEGLTGLMPIESGEVFWNRAPLPAARRKEEMFYMPDGIAPYVESSVVLALDFYRHIYGTARERLAEVVRQLELEPVQYKRVGALSKGYRRRLLLAVALLSSQPLLILDEPFDGLDLRQMLSVLTILKETRAAGRSLLLSIHQLADAERICDRFLLLDAGRLLGRGTLDELRAQAGLRAGGLEEVFLALT